MKSIFIATPMYGGMAAGIYGKSLLETFLYLIEKGYNVSYADIYNESLITRARNNLTHLFLKSGSDYLLFIDADQSFRAEDVLRMIESEKEVIAAPVPMKSINWNSVKKAVIDNEENFYEHGAVYNINGFEDRTRALIDEPLEVKYAGTGMILIHRSVFEKINHLVSSYCADTISGHEIPRGEIIKEYWKTDIDEDENRLLSEDFNFCKMFRSVGGKIYVDLQAKVGHLGSYLFSGQIYR